MKKLGTPLKIAAAVMAAALTLATAASGASARGQNAGEDVTYVATITNTTGNYLTPVNWAAHSNDVALFQANRPASPGVQAVAENGGVPVLAAEIAGAVDAAGLGTSGVGGGAPIPPGGSVTFEFTTSADRLSIVSMLICTNDGFAGLDSKLLPQGDSAKQYRLQGYDAGTELNTERRADLVPAPFCQLGSGLGTGESNPALAENGVVRRHQGIQGVGDLEDKFDWSGPVAELTVARK